MARVKRPIPRQQGDKDLTCTRTAPIAPGTTTPQITVSFDVPANVAGTRNTSAFVNNPSDPYLGNNSASAPITIIASADIAVSVDQPSAMRIGDTSSITYSVRNIGTAPTTGSPSVKLVVFMPASLEPVSTNSHDGWECSAVPRSGNQNAKIGRAHV